MSLMTSDDSISRLPVLILPEGWGSSSRISKFQIIFSWTWRLWDAAASCLLPLRLSDLLEIGNFLVLVNFRGFGFTCEKSIPGFSLSSQIWDLILTHLKFLTCPQNWNPHPAACCLNWAKFASSTSLLGDLVDNKLGTNLLNFQTRDLRPEGSV